LTGISDETVDIWLNESRKGKDSLKNALKSEFLSNKHPMKGINTDNVTIARDVLAKPAGYSFKQIINPDYPESDFIFWKHLGKTCFNMDLWVDKMEWLVENIDYWENRIIEGKSKYEEKKMIVNIGCGDRKIGLDGISIAVNSITGGLFVKRYIRPIDYYEPSFWCINLFGFKSQYIKQEIMNKLRKCFYVIYLTDCNPEIFQQVKSHFNRYVENRLKPLVQSKYNLISFEIRESEKSKWGEIYICVERV